MKNAGTGITVPPNASSGVARPQPSFGVPARAAHSTSWLHEWLVMGGLLLAAFYPVLLWIYERSVAADSYTSHAFLIPLISGYLIYSQRDELKKTVREPSAWGLVALVTGLLIFVVSGLLRVYFTSGFALLLCLSGMILYWGGWAWMKRVWFPVFFLVFMLPLPEIAIARINLYLKMLVTYGAVGTVDLLGVPVVMDGAKIQLEGGELIVGDACSGLRSLIALIALGVFYAWLYPRRDWLVRGSLLAAVIPVALGANMIRIVCNVLFANFFGTRLLFAPLFTSSLTGTVDLHLLSGVVVFAVALLALHLIMRGAEWLTDFLNRDDDAVETGSAA